MLILHLFWVQCLTVYSQDVSTLCCFASLPCHAPVCPTPPSNTWLVWQAASFPTSASPPGLQLEIGGSSRPVLFLEVSGLQDLNPVLAFNPKKWLLWKLTVDFLASSEAVWIENITLPSFQVKWQIVPPCPMPLSDQKIEFFTPHDVSLGTKRNTKSL